MNKTELAILERAYAAEIDSALTGSPNLIQTRSKVAAKLADEGLLKLVSLRFGDSFPVATIEGYQLTLAGNFIYCMSTANDPIPEDT